MYKYKVQKQKKTKLYFNVSYMYSYHGTSTRRTDTLIFPFVHLRHLLFTGLQAFDPSTSSSALQGKTIM